MLEYLSIDEQEKIKKMGEDLAAALGINTNEAIERLFRIYLTPPIDEMYKLFQKGLNFILVEIFPKDQIEIKNGMAYHKLDFDT